MSYSLFLAVCTTTNLTLGTTFGGQARRITMTNGNIYDVMRDMGHSNPQTTMGYLRFPQQRRLDDFPSLKDYITNHNNMPKNMQDGNKKMGTQYLIIPNLLGSSDA